MISNSTVDALKQTNEIGNPLKGTTGKSQKCKSISLLNLTAAQPYSDTYYQAPKPQRSNETSSSTRQSASTRHKDKEVAKPNTPQSESVSEEDNDPEQAPEGLRKMQKNLALPSKTMTVAGTRETIGSQVVQQTRIQCFNCKGYGHYAKECRKPKRVKDYAYHKEKMMMCKQAEQGVPLFPYDTADLANRFAPKGKDHDSWNTNPHVSKSLGVNHITSVRRPQLKCYQVKDKVVPNNSQVKFKKKEVEDHHRIFSISKKTKSVTACNDSLNFRTSNVNAVCAECGNCVFNSNHDACVSIYMNDVNARTKKPKVVPISASKPKRKANMSVATPHKKTVASDTTIQKSKSYNKELYENTNQEWKWWIAKRCPSGYKWTQKPLRTKKIWMPKIRKEDVSTSISPTIDIVSRITNVLKISNLSNVPSSSNSLADCATHPIRC
ncbi:retrovirus-related pol polyprotein from transposon TNT 1-94 [Tanacetum coccineum]